MTPALKQASSPSFTLRWSQQGIGPSSPAGRGEDCFFEFGLGVIAGLFQLNMREVGQFVGRDHAVDNGRAVALESLVDGIAQLAGPFGLKPTPPQARASAT
jgi:hypothetical protein